MKEKDLRRAYGRMESSETLTRSAIDRIVESCEEYESLDPVSFSLRSEIDYRTDFWDASSEALEDSE
jgi:hypothetical protein